MPNLYPRYVMKCGLFGVLLFGLLGCATPALKVKHRGTIKLNRPPAASLSNATDVKSRLMSQYAEWKGTPYKMGGTTRRGVDCSGFVQLTFREVLGIKVPRTTRLLSTTGHPVDRGALRVGDLVLFKTGISMRHVGIYMGNNTFLHASSYKGVTLTNLNQVYWKKRYWRARRVGNL